MATPAPLSYSATVSPIVAGRWLGVQRQAIVPDGIYTWCDTTTTAIYRNGATYIGWVDKSGRGGVSKFTHATKVVESYAFPDNAEIDDHNMASLHFRPDGRLVAMYGPHNTSGFIYRVALYPESVSAWGPSNFRGVSQGNYSYPFMTRFSQVPNRYFFFSRRWLEDTSGGTRVCSFRFTDRLDGEVGGAAPDPWSQPNDIWRVDNKIPYWQYASDGINKFHVFATDMHPVQGQSSLFHFYMQLDPSDNTPRYFNSFGVEIPSPPVTPSTATKVYDGATVRCWVSDAAIRNGSPVVLWMRYPQNDHWPNTIEYWHSRFVGGEWQSTLITTDGPGLYQPEIYYHGGLSFDANNPDVIYFSAPHDGQRQIQEWRTTDAGESWQRNRFVTSGAYTGLRARPYSPRGHNGEMKVIWWEGRYTTFLDYETAIWGSR